MKEVAARHARGRRADRDRQHGREPRAPRCADARASWGDGRRLRARRDAGSDPRRDAEIRRERGRAACARMASQERIHPARSARADVRARRVRADNPGRVRRHGARRGLHVRCLRGAVARLYRRWLARHALGNRGRTDPWRRHRRAEAEMAAEDRVRGGAADCRVHRAEYRLRPCIAQDARGERRSSRR